MESIPISKKTKFLYLLELSLISVFFAEVIAGSMPFPYFDLWGYFVVIPLYGIHTILLIKFITSKVKNKRVLLVTLLVAGGIFGLYEAYLTKVLWTGLAVDSVIVMDIAIIDFIVLVFFWHPVMSFIIPLLVFEKVFTSTRYISDGLPKKIKLLLSKKYTYIIVFVLVGFFSTLNGQVDTLLLSKVVMLIPIFIIGYYLRKKETPSFEEILPQKTGTIDISIYLFMIYVGLALFIKPEVLTVRNQIVIGVIYLLYFILFFFKIRNNKKEIAYESEAQRVENKTIIVSTITILLSGTIPLVIMVLLGVKEIGLIVTWLTWVVIGLVLFVYSIIGRK